MPNFSTPPPSPPPSHTASTTARVTIPLAPPVPLASDGAVNDPELERRWASVKARLSAVLDELRQSRQPVRSDPGAWVTMYTDVAQLYSQNDDLRKRRMYTYVRQFVKDLVSTQLNHLKNLSGQQLLAEYCRTWRASVVFIKFMKRVLHHLHRFWIPANANTVKDDPVRPLDKLLMFYWREDLLSHLHTVITIALDLVNEDRRGVPIDHDIVRGVVDTLVEIGSADTPENDSDSSSEEQPESSSSLPNLHLYIRVFEDDFLTLTRAFYKAEGEKMVSVGDVTKFMRSVVARLDEESRRGKRLLHSSSGARLRQATEEQLIGNHKEYLQKEATGMIKAGREEDLKLLYKLLSRVENGLNPLRTFFVGYVRAEGNAIVVNHMDKTAAKDDMRTNLGLVRVLIQLYRKHASLIKRCFDGSQVILLGIDDAFRGFTNRSLGSLSLPNLIAHYVDHLLRLGTEFDRFMWDTSETGRKAVPVGKEKDKNGDEAGSDSTCADEASSPPTKRMKLMRNAPGPATLDVSALDKIEADEDKEDGFSRYMTELVRLFMFLDDKDLFFETHRRLFAKRLLASHDEDMEMQFISKVKVQMGPTYTQRLSGMLKDKVVSNTMRAEFAQYLDKKRSEYDSPDTIRDQKAPEMPDNTGSGGDGKAVAPVGTSAQMGVAVADAVLASEPTTAPAAPMSASGTLSSNQLPPPNALQAPPTAGNSMLMDATRVSGWRRNPVSANAPNVGESEKPAEQEVTTEDEITPIQTEEVALDITRDALHIDFNAHVLNALHWPSVKVADLRVPPILEACQRLFSDFYMKDKEARKLTWIHALSTVNLSALLGGKQYTLVVSTFQACTLLLLNSRDSITVGEACEELNINRGELHQHIKPLLLARKCRLLRLQKRPEGHSKEQSNEAENAKTWNFESVGQSTRGEQPRTSTMDIETVLVEKRGGVEPGAENRDTQQSLGPTALQLTQGEESQWQGDRNCSADAVENAATAPDMGAEDTQGGSEDGEQESTSDIIGEIEKPRSMMEADQAGRKGDETDNATAGEDCGDHESDDELGNADVIRLNLNFRSRSVRIVVPASVAKLASADAAVSKRNVVVDRSTQIDATLVKILKARKETTHAALTAEVIEVLAPMFLPDPRLIKARLERLIDQEYVERDKSDARLYTYIA